MRSLTCEMFRQGHLTISGVDLGVRTKDTGLIKPRVMRRFGMNRLPKIVGPSWRNDDGRDGSE